MYSRSSCRCESFRISISAASRYLLSFSAVISRSICSSSSGGMKFRVAWLRHRRPGFPWDSYSAEYVMRNRLRWDERAKERKRVLLIRRVRVRMSYIDRRMHVRAAHFENSKQLEGNLIMKHRSCRLPSRSLSVKWLLKMSKRMFT